MAQQYNPRIAKLLELEASGRIKPEHKAELNRYRAMGIVKALPAPKNALTPSAATAALNTANSMNTLLGQLNEVENYYNKNLKGAGLGSIMEYLPTQNNKAIDAAYEGLQPLLKSLIRGPGEGPWTDQDQAKLERISPSRFAFDKATEQQIKQIRRMAYNKMGKQPPANAGGQPNIIDFYSLPEE